MNNTKLSKEAWEKVYQYTNDFLHILITKKKAIIPIAIMVVIAVSVMILGNTDKKKTAIETVNNMVSVKVQKVNLIPKSSGIEFKASLEASDEGVASCKVGGTVVQILFESGKYVSQGEALVKLDDQDARNNLKAAESQLSAAQTSLTGAEVNLQLAQNDFNRKKVLYDSNAISKVDLENAEAALRIAQANLELVKAGIQTSRVNVENLKDSISNAIIKAPISGIMDEKNVHLGEYVNPGTMLAKVKTTDPIDAVIEVEQNNLEYIKVGQKAQVKVGENNLKVYEGTVKSVDVSADSSSRVSKCKIQLDNKNQELKPGIFALVEISGNEKVEITAIPIEALIGNQDSYHVYINDNGIARKRNVTIGETDKNVVEIKNGIQKGESVICSNVNTLQDGEAISVVSE